MAANTPIPASARLNFLERLVLDTPYLFLKKIPYAWIPVVAFWAWPPVIPALFLAIILLGLGMMVLQQRFWEAKIARENGGITYRVRPRMPLWMRVRNLALVLAGFGLVGWLLNGRLGMTALQWFLLLAGFMLLYMDLRLFGPSSVYVVTPRGIGARYVPGHVDYRLFFPYDEIKSITRVQEGGRLPEPLDILTPLRGKKDGVLLTAKHGDGFSPEIGHVLLTPDDPEEFLRQMPPGFVSGRALIR